MRIGLRDEDLPAARTAAESGRLAVRPRLYGIGMGKTGTSALASLFPSLPAAHEPEAEAVIAALLDYETGRSDWRALHAFVTERDRRLGLTVDVSNLNVFLVDLLVELAPTARYVLTVRDPYRWLDSITNHYLARPPTARWRAFALHRFGADGAAHPEAERALAEAGLFTLAGYLSYWRAHIARAFAIVPAERLLVVRTERIVAEADRIAAFARFAPGAADATAIREYRNPDKRPLVARIPRAHLEEQVHRHCAPFLGHLFPEITSAADAGFPPP